LQPDIFRVVETRVIWERMLRLALAVVLGLAAGTELACADVYTWTDAKGIVNVSNLAPPDGARVENVVHDIARAVVPPSVPAPVPNIDPLAQAEVQILAMRVRQLEYEVDFAKRHAPAVEYVPVPMPTMQYGIEPPPQSNYGCDPSWFGCGAWAFGGYPAGVVILGAPNFRRPFPHRRNHQVALQGPVRGRGGPPRR
jgi:hypothetical protein